MTVSSAVVSRDHLAVVGEEGPQPTFPTVGERIRYARELYQMSQPVLADIIGVSRAAISQYENGVIHQPRAEMIERLARLFGIGPEWFVWGRGRPPQPPAAKTIAVAHVPAALRLVWLQTLADFEAAHPGCQIAVWTDGVAMTAAEGVKLLQGRT